MFHALIKSEAEFRSQYIVGDQIGFGSFGHVYIIENMIKNTKPAAKFIRKRGPQRNRRVRKEIDILASLHHKNVLEYIESYSAKEGYIIVTNYYSGRNLHDAREVEESKIIIYVRQICEGLQYLHENKVVHRDIKPTNIVIENEDSTHIRIIDFGVSCYLNDEYSRGLHGTWAYLPPEVYKNEPVTGATDMWSLGVTTFWLLSFTLPFPTFAERVEKISNVQFTYSPIFEIFSAEARTFINNLLVGQPELRLTASSAQQHVWLSDAHKLNLASTSTSTAASTSTATLTSTPTSE